MVSLTQVVISGPTLICGGAATVTVTVSMLLLQRLERFEVTTYCVVTDGKAFTRLAVVELSVLIGEPPGSTVQVNDDPPNASRLAVSFGQMEVSERITVIGLM